MPPCYISQICTCLHNYKETWQYRNGYVGRFIMKFKSFDSVIIYYQSIRARDGKDGWTKGPLLMCVTNIWQEEKWDIEHGCYEVP